MSVASVNDRRASGHETRKLRAAGRGIVLTSLNPKSRLEYQIECLTAWKALGLYVVACQAASESQALRAKVGSLAEVFEMPESATGWLLHGSPAPRIMPVLHLALNHYRPDFLILTNSDIYPCVRKAPTALFTQQAAYAFTRKEVLTLSAAAKSTKMYRGGVDVFAFTIDALAAAWNYLESDPIAERMTFGVPGWDYFLSATILRPGVEGAILDGPFLLHQSHRTTYGHVREFGHYINSLRTLGSVQSADPSLAASEFAGYLAQQCEQNAAFAHRIQMMYGAFYVKSTKGRHAYVPQAVLELCRLDPLLARYKPIIDDIYLHLVSRDISLEGLQSYLFESESTAVRFEEYLSLLYLVIKVRHCTGEMRLRKSYPKGNAHKAAMTNVSRVVDVFEKRFQLLDVLSTELLLHGILNPNDFRAIALCCVNDHERQLVRSIIQALHHENRSSAAAGYQSVALGGKNYG